MKEIILTNCERNFINKCIETEMVRLLVYSKIIYYVKVLHKFVY